MMYSAERGFFGNSDPEDSAHSAEDQGLFPPLGRSLDFHRNLRKDEREIMQMSLKRKRRRQDSEGIPA